MVNTKTVLSHKGFSIRKDQLKPEEIHKHKKNLLIRPYVPRAVKFYKKVDTPPINLFTYSKTRVYLPRYYAAKQHYTPEKTRWPEHDLISAPFKGKLREKQQTIVDKSLKAMREQGGGVISVPCGYGKTVMGIYIIGALQAKTLVIVHTSVILNQWKERLAQFMPEASVGELRQDRIELENDVVIGMVHSISMKDYPEIIFRCFGLVIVDEIHLMCTRVFSQAFPKVAAKYTLGMSATPFRNDRCETIFQYFIGDLLHYEKRPPNQDTVVQRVLYHIKGFEPYYQRNGDLSYVRTLQSICNNEARTKAIVKELIKLGRKGRKVLVLGEYTKHLKNICRGILEATQCTAVTTVTDVTAVATKQENEDFVKDLKNITCGLYIGEMKEAERKISEGKDIIIGTYKLASVGMDIPALNTLMLVSPRKDIEQSVGRILRKEQAFKPMIIDFVDSFRSFLHQGKQRETFYRKNGYSVHYINMYDDAPPVDYGIRKRAPSRRTRPPPKIMIMTSSSSSDESSD